MARKSPVDTHIGQRLKEYRQHRGMTVRELADAAHITPGQISRYEHGRDRISHERVTEFARILRIKSNDLYQPPGSRLRRNHVRWGLTNFMAAVIAEAAALMSSWRKAAADNEATMVAAVAVAVAVSAAASDADAGERASLAISGNDTAVDTSIVSGSEDSFTVNSDAALKLSPVSHSVAGTLTEHETVEAINGKPAGTVSETRAFKIDAGATQQLDGSDAVNALVRTDGTNADAISLPGNHAIKAAWHASDDGREHSADHSRHTPAQDDDNTSAVIGGAHTAHRQGDESESAVSKFADDGKGWPPADHGHHANADPETNFPSNAKNHPQHADDNLLHTLAQHDDNGSPVSTDGAYPGRGQGDGNEWASPKFADDGGDHPGKISHDLPALTSLPSDVSGDDSPHSFNPNLDHHASADPSLNDITNDHPPQHSADNSLHTPAQHDESGSPVVSDGAHPADQVDGKQSDSFKFADNDSAHSGTGLDGAHPADPQVDLSQLKFADDGSGHPGTGPDGAHPAHAQVDVDQLPSFKFADNDSAHPGTIPIDPPALTAPSSDSSGAHGPAASALAKPSDIPGAVMSAAPDQFVFADKADHGLATDHKSDMTEIDHPVPADIQQVLDTAHAANAVSPPDPGHTTAPQDMTKVQLPHHHGDFHFA
jgi:transcriptional regulator with XRE-family HTH domain